MKSEMLFVKVSEGENQDETVEIPVEAQGHILMTTLTAQFPGACGLKFKTEQATWRGVRVVDDKLYPAGDDKWSESCVYTVSYPKDAKRKGDDLDVNSSNKSRKIERKCVDLIVLGIPWKSTEEAVKRYFEQYGEVVLCEVKRDGSNNSKGFGFVRFKEYNNQCSVLGKKHFIDGRWCDVKIPNSQEPEVSRKIFVGRLSESITTKDLQDYFSKYGQVIDVYIPKPFRAFGFVTFVEADIQEICKENHIIKEVSVHVSKADPKEEDSPYGSYQHQVGYNSGGNFHHSQSYHPSRNESHRGRGGDGFSSRNGGYSHHGSDYSGLSYSQSHHGGLSNSNGSSYSRGSRGGAGGPPRNKMNKYDHHSSNDLYDPMTRRSPNMPPGHHGSNGNSSSGQSYDQMNAMMSMFNPMMAAFIQQLAQQTNSQPVEGGHPSQWNGNSMHHGGDFSRNSNLSAGMSNIVGGGGGYSQANGGSNGSNYTNSHSRYKN